jgi:hypothetical protein
MMSNLLGLINLVHSSNELFLFTFFLWLSFLDYKIKCKLILNPPETGDPVRATKTVCCTIRISLNYRGHGDPLKNYQYSWDAR